MCSPCAGQVPVVVAILVVRSLALAFDAGVTN